MAFNANAKEGLRENVKLRMRMMMVENKMMMVIMLRGEKTDTRTHGLGYIRHIASSIKLQTADKRTPPDVSEKVQTCRRLFAPATPCLQTKPLDVAVLRSRSRRSSQASPATVAPTCFTGMLLHRRSPAPVWRTPCVNITFEACSLELSRRRHPSSFVACRRVRIQRRDGVKLCVCPFKF